MIYSNYYNWIEIYMESDLLWLDNVTPWEDAGGANASELYLLDLLYFTAFTSSYYFISPETYTSMLDIVVIWFAGSEDDSILLFNSLILDVYNTFSVFFLKLHYFYYLDYKNYITLFLYYNPELMVAMVDFYDSYFNSYAFNYLPSAVRDLFTNKFDTVLLDFLGYFKWLVLSISFLFFFMSLARIGKVNTSLDFYFTRVFVYFYSFSKDYRIQFEVLLQLFFFVILVWIFAIMSYNDSQVEFIEMLHLMIVYFFLFIIGYLLYKYSTHYFSFLEASVIEGKSASFIGKQFVRDISNTFALFLRFFLLLFRLNIYDGLDDFLDSYYIFFCDFDDDTYYDELLVLFDGALFYTPDNNTDASLFNDTETDLLEDIFQKYYVTWGKFFMFWAFILEEAFRISLALYITYLIIFEVHSANFSYSEDMYFASKRK